MCVLALHPATARRPVPIGRLIRVPITSDLILLKLSAGGSIDQQDIIRLLAVGRRDRLIAEVNEKISELPLDAEQLWARLITASS